VSKRMRMREEKRIIADSKKYTNRRIGLAPTIPLAIMTVAAIVLSVTYGTAVPIVSVPGGQA